TQLHVSCKRRFPGQGNRETTPLPWFAFHTHAAAMQTRHLCHECQAQPGTGGFPRQARIDLYEGLEESLQILFGDTNSRIPDGEVDQLFLAISSHLQPDLSAAGCELYRIAQQVHEDLLEAA